MGSPSSAQPLMLARLQAQSRPTPLSTLCLAPRSKQPAQVRTFIHLGCLVYPNLLGITMSQTKRSPSSHLPAPSPSQTSSPVGLPQGVAPLAGQVRVLRAISTPPCPSLPLSSSSPSCVNSSSSLGHSFTSLHPGCHSPSPCSHHLLPAPFKSLTCPLHPPVAFPVCDG